MTTAQLLISDSEHHADMLYISKIFVPDAFIAIGLQEASGTTWHGLFSPLEIGRAQKESNFDHTHLDTPWRDHAKQQGWQASLATVAAAFLQAHNVSHLTVPGDFPLMYADTLRALGLHVRAQQGTLFPQRAIKNDIEILHLTHAEQLTKSSMMQAEQFLAACSIGSDHILRHPDDAEEKIEAKHVRAAIETYLIAQGAMPAHTIVACGQQACDPHNIGSGFIYAHEPIIIDIFPRLLDSGYWGDMTRTYVKGKASTTIKKMYQVVLEGQDIGLAQVCAGAKTRDIHQSILNHFEQQGFPTTSNHGQQQGFFHGTGHGVGLDIHEAPRVSLSDDRLQCHQVVTVEPGLYYPNLGGIRLEDMVVVQHQGCDNLTQHERILEID
ncbi:MAG: Xaa-Pro peptidase family protein [Mariprofundaceae bacterium]|nr:Xaa-Pro peptidase family protein [Mariprofundaceae bacterium]